MVHCLHARDNYDAFVSTSHNSGVSWSAPTALEASVKVPGSGWMGPGVGGGIQIPSPSSTSAMTLMILAEERWNNSFNAVPPPHNYPGRNS
eukprot:SAG25_NODE_13013_length_272_cov_1.023121_1_plen_90_part_11